MNLEIIISHEVIKVSADWFWYLFLFLLMILQCMLLGLKIQEIFLKRKLKALANQQEESDG